jgi:hypothetical protein
MLVALSLQSTSGDLHLSTEFDCTREEACSATDNDLVDSVRVASALDIEVRVGTGCQETARL